MVHCTIILLFVTISIQSFEVKVLLKKYPQLSKKVCVEIKSPHGLILSSHPYLSAGTHSTSCQVQLDKQLLKSRCCYVTPALSKEQEQQLGKYVDQWLYIHKQDCLEQGKQLYDFFDTFVGKKSKVATTSYHELEQYILDIADIFLQDVDDASYLILQKHFRTLVKHRIIIDFLETVAQKKLSKKDRELLASSQAYRYDFFLNHVKKLISNFLKEFMALIPRNLIAKVLQQDESCLSFEGTDYIGSFLLYQDKDACYLINCLDIDEYLLSVVRHEGWPGWPLEVNKVLAITCRTYLVWQILQAQKLKRPYHIQNDIVHQTYKGRHTSTRLKQAVQDTRDMCIAYESKPILAMFDSCCGGVMGCTSSKDYNKHPYLQKKDQCTFCKGCKVAHWKAEFCYENMLNRLQKEIHSLTSIDDIKVIRKNDTSVVDNILIMSDGVQISLSGKKLYSLFPEVKSFCFDVVRFPKKKEESQVHRKKWKKKKKHEVVMQDPVEQEPIKKFEIVGKGYGHHVGLCQWGAMKLVKEHHWSYPKILQFYYPGTTLIKLDYQR